MKLVADIGGTRSRLALIDADGRTRSLRIMANNDWPTLDALVRGYLDAASAAEKVRVAAFAVAAPVTGDELRMTNRAWHFHRDELRAALDLEHLAIVNDFTAVALSLPHLEADDLVRIGGGEKAAGAAMATIGPGTGLGVSGLVPGRTGYHAINGEGGHVTLCGNTDEERAVIGRVRETHGHCSAERLISGPGLATLYDALSRVRGEPSGKIAPAQVSKLADAGDRTAADAIDMMCALLGSVAGNLALTLGARGGVYLAGGVLPALRERFLASTFRARFEDKGRYRDYLAAIPTYLVVASTPALAGLAALLRDVKPDT